jgi:uncharacterized membrane protein/glutaredoxin
MIPVTLYTRKDCHLCEQAKADLEALQEKVPHDLVEVDIESDPALNKKYMLEIPVVEIGPYHIKAPFNRQELEVTLRAASDRKSHIEKLDASPATQIKITSSDRISYWIAKHYMLIFNLFLLLYVGVPFLAPVFKKAGWDGAANVVYKVYRPLCHQWGFRSFFLFGEQLAYPHEEANLPGLTTFEEATGITDANDPGRNEAREFEGNTEMGYKVALCERDVAIWGSLLLFGILFVILKRRLPKVHWLVLTVIGLAPIGLDGVSQLISQLPLNSTFLSNILPYRESTPLLRSISGAIFGIAMGWLFFNGAEDAMGETREYLSKKIARAGK